MWFWWALSASVLSAIATVLIKHCLKKTSASVLSWSLVTLSMPFVAWLAFKNGETTQVNSWFYLGALGSSILFSLALILRLSATKRVELSKVAPLTSFNPVFAYILGLIFLRENLNLTGVLGLLLITFGAYILSHKNRNWNLKKTFSFLISERSSRLFLIGIGLTSVSVIFDKTSVINTLPLNPALTLLLENILISGLIFGFLKLRKPGWIVEFKSNFWLLLLTSLVYGLGGFCILNGFSQGPVALVIGIKQLQIFFTLILSLVIFKDRPGRHTVIATTLMTLGVILIKLL